MEDAYELHKDLDVSLNEICLNLANAYEMHKNFDAPFPLESVQDFEKIKDKVSMKVINVKKNQLLLRTRPHTVISDLATIYHLEVSRSESGSASIPIDQNLMKSWGISVQELHNTAIQNGITKKDYVLADIEKLIFLARDENFLAGDHYDGHSPMLVLSNTSRMYGACALANPSVLEKVTEVVNDDIYILPSSLHEVIIVPKGKASEMDITPKDLGDMVREVNRCEVDQDERLSNHVYEFNRDTKSLEICKDAKQKSKEMER